MKKSVARVLMRLGILRLSMIMFLFVVVFGLYTMHTSNVWMFAIQAIALGSLFFIKPAVDWAYETLYEQ